MARQFVPSRGVQSSSRSTTALGQINAQWNKSINAAAAKLGVNANDVRWWPGMDGKPVAYDYITNKVVKPGDKLTQPKWSGPASMANDAMRLGGFKPENITITDGYTNTPVAPQPKLATMGSAQSIPYSQGSPYSGPQQGWNMPGNSYQGTYRNYQQIDPPPSMFGPSDTGGFGTNARQPRGTNAFMGQPAPNQGGMMYAGGSPYFNEGFGGYNTGWGSPTANAFMERAYPAQSDMNYAGGRPTSQQGMQRGYRIP